MAELNANERRARAVLKLAMLRGGEVAEAARKVAKDAELFSEFVAMQEARRADRQTSHVM